VILAHPSVLVFSKNFVAEYKPKEIVVNLSTNEASEIEKYMLVAYPLLEELLLLKSLETEEITIKRYQFSSASVLHHAIMNSFQLKISNNLPSNLNNLSSSYNHCVHCLGTKLS